MQRSGFDQDTPHSMMQEKINEEEIASSALLEVDAQKKPISSQRFIVVRGAAYILTTLLVLTCAVSIFFLTIDLLFFRILLWIWAISAGVFITVGLRINPKKRDITL
jgi:hypothetical protein